MKRRAPLFALTCAFARMAIGSVYSLRWPRFRRMLEHANRQQKEYLLERVRLCRDTKFGRDHGFGEIHSIEDFQKRVPISRYDYFAPYIDAVARGEVTALIPESEKLQRFTITTGSSGTPKLNPVTNTWMKQYRQAWDIWGLKLFADHPSHLGEQMLQLAGKWDMGRTPSGMPISMVSALLARAQNPMLRPFYATPSSLNDIPDPTARYYAALRIAIPQRVGWLVLMNPGTVIRLAEIGDEFKEQLIRDLRDGTLSSEFDIPTAVRDSLQRRIRRQHAIRARELERIAGQSGRLYPQDYWGETVLACWLGGTAGFQKRSLPKYFGNSPMRDMGLVSSEGRHTIPIEDDKPEGVPSLMSGFYEYLPVEEAASTNPTVVPGHDLEVDRDYFLLMTTAAGYYRFNIGDVVRCRGYVGEAPLLDFLQKADRCGDLEGEKLTEHQFLESAHAVAAGMGVDLTEITTVPVRESSGRPRYLILAETGDFGDRDRARDFLRTLDAQLMSINFLYAARRREGVLDPARLLLLESGAWQSYIRAETDRRGTGDFQYKHPGLVDDPGWIEQFTVQSRIDLDGHNHAG